jgi:hypothetical protein
MREYWRAGQVSSEHGMAALAFMRAAYPDATETTATVALIYGSNPSLETIARDGFEPSGNEAPVSYAAAPLYETPASYQTLPSYATRDDATPADDIAASGDVRPADVSQMADIAPSVEASATPETDVPEEEVPTPPPAR